MIQFQSYYKSGFCEVSMHSHHEMSGNVCDILFCCQKANYLYIYLLHQCTHNRRCSKSVYTSLRANKRKQLPRCCRPSTACFLVKPVLPCSGWRPSLRVRTSLTRCVFNDVARVITIEWHLRNFENYNVLQKFPHSWFQATCIWEKEHSDISSVVCCSGMHRQSPFGTCRFSLWQLRWRRIEIWPKKGYTNHKEMTDLSTISAGYWDRIRTNQEAGAMQTWRHASCQPRNKKNPSIMKTASEKSRIS